MVENKVPRGLRNNNPFNIKRSQITWLGEVDGKDKVFECFSSLELGARAGLKLLLNYVSNGFTTPRQIIERFAPSSENDTENYISFVCSSNSGTSWIRDCDYLTTKEQLCRLASRIIQYECGLSLNSLHRYKLDSFSLLHIRKKYNL